MTSVGLTIRDIRNREPLPVMIPPGQCVAWRCDQPAEDGKIACSGHARDFDWKLRASEAISPEEAAELDGLPPAERKRRRNRLYMSKRRERQRQATPTWSPPDHREPAQVSRRRMIAEKLRAKGSVRTSELATECGVSTDAIKRDLWALHRQGLCVKIYGGAQLPEKDDAWKS